MKYIKVFFLCMLVVGLSSCDTDDDIEYWLSGTWNGTVGSRDASFIFNENRSGSFRIEGGDYGDFRWYFEDEEYWDAPSGTIILDFGANDKACIAGSWADRASLSGWYYEYYVDYLDGFEGRTLVLRRVGF